MLYHLSVVTLNRPRTLNALGTSLFNELNTALKDYESDTSIGAIVLAGHPKAFAAGADIREMADKTFADVYSEDFIQRWGMMYGGITKPIIAAVSGHALGGGCELAMMADIIYCTRDANFGQPEIKLGIIPGAGGTQRLVRAIGKSKAMEIILTGSTFTGAEAEAWGLAAKTFEDNERCVEGAVATAGKIAALSRLAVKAAKEACNKSQELGLREGIDFERRLFYSLFGSQDQKIGMKAFIEKKKPEWSNL